MKCRDVVELMTDYLEDALSPADRRRFEEHLTTCDGCTVYLEQLRTTMRLTGKIGNEVMPPELEAELLLTFRDWKRGG
jgi:anti-sigma factor RsiW